MTQPAPAARSASPPARLERSPWLSMPDVDVLVVGAGPAGAVAARHAKQAAPELDVVLLERDRAVGAPVRCAEGVGDAGLREFANPEGADWFRAASWTSSSRHPMTPRLSSPIRDSAGFSI